MRLSLKSALIAGLLCASTQGLAAVAPSCSNLQTPNTCNMAPDYRTCPSGSSVSFDCAGTPVLDVASFLTSETIVNTYTASSGSDVSINCLPSGGYGTPIWKGAKTSTTDPQGNTITTYTFKCAMSE